MCPNWEKELVGGWAGRLAMESKWRFEYNRVRAHEKSFLSQSVKDPYFYKILLFYDSRRKDANVKQQALFQVYGLSKNKVNETCLENWYTDQRSEWEEMWNRPILVSLLHFVVNCCGFHLPTSPPTLCSLLKSLHLSCPLYFRQCRRRM